MTRKVNRKSFTLIELIIAITIFSIIAVSIFSVFRIGVKLWYRTTPLIQANQSGRFFFDTISSDLKNSVYYNKSGINFEGESQKISFMTLVNVSGQGVLSHTELARVIYYFDRTAKVVKRAVATMKEGLSEDYAKAADILNNIDSKDFGFEYCYKLGSSPTEYDYEWKGAWEDEDRDKGKIPRGIRIKVGEYSKTIFIPTGTLGGKDAT